MASSEKSAFAANIDTAVTPFLSILRDAGRERERLALELGTEVAKELNPFSLVTLAIAAGFFIGHGPFKWRQEADAGRGSGGELPTVYQGVFSAAREGLKVVPVFNMAQATLRRRSAIDRRARPWL